MSMTKKDYEVLARVIKSGIYCKATVPELAEVLAETLADDNPKFDKKKFLIACGLEG